MPGWKSIPVRHPLFHPILRHISMGISKRDIQMRVYIFYPVLFSLHRPKLSGGMRIIVPRSSIW